MLKIALSYHHIQKSRISMYTPGVSAGFSAGPLPLKLYCGPLSKFTFSGLYVPGAVRDEKSVCTFTFDLIFQSVAKIIQTSATWRIAGPV